jgi:hypothetical protein
MQTAAHQLSQAYTIEDSARSMFRQAMALPAEQWRGRLYRMRNGQGAMLLIISS